MRFLPVAGLLLCVLSTAAGPQQAAGDQATLTVSTTLVEVPALVKTKGGELVFELTADDFGLTDNGVVQRLTLEQDTDVQPVAMVVVVETGGAGARHLEDYAKLGPVLDSLIGSVEHRVALVGADSAPHLLVPFSADTDAAAAALANVDAGDNGAAILDGLVFAIGQLRVQPARYRREILLLSETIDQGSTSSLAEALRLISDTNTEIYSFGFSSTRSAVSHEASKLQSTTPGPEHGCFSKEGADKEYDGHYSAQVLDCLSQLAPPLRLATMTYLTARNALRTNTAESLARLTGGEFVHFHDAKDLQRGLIAISNDLPNRYVLTFRPTSLTPGAHALHLVLKDRPQLELKSRSAYWIDDETAH